MTSAGASVRLTSLTVILVETVRRSLVPPLCRGSEEVHTE
nr:MAG TPA: hypothetical protein [Caudoviricetes sp.]